ncbi:MAG: stomatin-like protein [Oscillatoria sp. PMC 1051.18]|uniref:SPFH domain-containing protein n=1 Tax=Oscillatoria salina TaxID=331517 RepID=UPI0013BAC5E5|nr:stomatin-like protein [Oscillatoria salina]MBZ8178698.1 paraslipin [Oscillatoria salina IIICB1]MEC4893783.1 stomatin-like protein [Oscillatoria sp. PMC 1050.18]MEC5029797.1 stomatin-like protein [Oscillatoria sp. PMC 1051.18]NET88276.1 paraslipin [Kamptonema sp. SIO1D9]
MNSFLSLLIPIAVAIGYAISSVKIINEGNEALVERVGKFHKKLKPGLNYIVPIIETVVVRETTRERVIDIQPQNAITKDNVSLQADAVVYWRIFDLEKAYYEVDDLQSAISNLVVTTLRSEIGQMQLEETYSSRNEINQKLLHQLDEATDSWGVKVTRVEVQEITPPKTIIESLELERAAESKKRADIAETEGKVQSIQMLSQALRVDPGSPAFLQFLIAQRYVDANEKLGNSPNSKVLFMDPKALSEALTDLISPEDVNVGGHDGNGAG